MSATVLEIKGLRVAFGDKRRSTLALRDVSFSLEAGKTLALVGESGSGKSITSLAVMGLLPRTGKIVAGEIHYRTRDNAVLNLAEIDQPTLRRIRGREISMIFQEPMSSLNPLFTVGDQIGEMLELHTDLAAADRRKRVIEMLEMVEIPAAASRYRTYPHELSGGMRQRVMIALAMICNPALLIADEPTTALDVTIQAQILDLMHRLQKELGMSILFVTHDMGVVAEMADKVAVMYAGAIVETAPVKALYARPTHPYTQGLLASIPRHDRPEGERIRAIPGTVPSLYAMPLGCAFAPRCSLTGPECTAEMKLVSIGNEHDVACIKRTRVSANV